MTNNFGTVKSILDDNFSSGLVTDTGMRDALQRLSDSYKELFEGQEVVDYASPDTHAAYTYRSLVPHADWISRALSAGGARLEKGLPPGSINVVSIGGGPGTDLLGLLKYLRLRDLGHDVSIHVIDREPAWQACWSRLIAATETNSTISASFSYADLTDAATIAAEAEIAAADLVITSFVLSEVWRFNASGCVSKSLEKVRDLMKPGAWFVYVDNCAHTCNTNIESTIGSRSDFKIIGAQDDEGRRVGQDEKTDIISGYKKMLGESPKLKGEVAHRLWQKK